MMKKVAVLGVGPAGLLAGYAASLVPNTFVSFFAQGGEQGPTKSVINGAQFVHRPIPILHRADNPDAVIRYVTVGSPASYKEKVYGVGSAVPFVSMSNVHDGLDAPAWSMSKTYDALWSALIVPERVNVIQITPEWLVNLIEGGFFDVIVSSIPRSAICLSHAGLIAQQHSFTSQSIRVMGRSAFDLPDNTVIYDGTSSVSWYRTSNIMGVGSTEWGESAPAKLPHYDEITSVTKPISTNCTCFSDDVLHVGRYGEWRKGVLAHEAFVKTFAAIAPERKP
jgi:hypothetical protein